MFTLHGNVGNATCGIHFVSEKFEDSFLPSFVDAITTAANWAADLQAQQEGPIQLTLCYRGIREIVVNPVVNATEDWETCIERARQDAHAFYPIAKLLR